MKINKQELVLAREELYTNKNTLEAQLNMAQAKAQGIIASPHFKSGAKEALNNELTNYTIPLLLSYVDYINAIYNDLDRLIQRFGEVVDESSDSAVIDTSVFPDLKKSVDTSVESILNEIGDMKLATAYAEIGAIVEVSNPSTSDIVEKQGSAKNSLDKTQKNMESFNKEPLGAALTAIQGSIAGALRKVSKTVTYSDPYLTSSTLSLYQDASFKKEQELNHKSLQTEVATTIQHYNPELSFDTSRMSARELQDLGHAIAVASYDPHNKKKFPPEVQDFLKRNKARFDSLKASTYSQKKPEKQIEQTFKQNLQTQYGFDKETATTMWKLYRNIKKKEGANADYVFNRLVGGVVYDTTYKDKLMWANTAGVGGEAGHHGSLGILDQLEKEYGLTSAEYKKLSQAIGDQHKDSAKKGFSDFAHQSITTATSLYRGGHLRSANIIAFENSYKNTTVPWYEQVPKAISKWFGAKEYTDELAGWRGDATGEALKEPMMGNDDYKADLDSVNIVSLMKKKDVDYATAVNQYYKDIREGEYTRARAFVENSGGRDRILKELLDAELIEENNTKIALKELREKNRVAYDFYNSLTADNGKGSNDLIKEGAN